MYMQGFSMNPWGALVARGCFVFIPGGILN